MVEQHFSVKLDIVLALHALHWTTLLCFYEQWGEIIYEGGSMYVLQFYYILHLRFQDIYTYLNKFLYFNGMNECCKYKYDVKADKSIK